MQKEMQLSIGSILRVKIKRSSENFLFPFENFNLTP